MKKNCWFVGLLVCWFAYIGTANSALIDFEDVAHGTFLSNSSTNSGGFVVSHSGSFAAIYGNSGQAATDFSGNGTKRLISFNASTISLFDGSVFDLTQFDGGESWVFNPHFWATSISVTGFLSGGGTTTQDFDLDLIKDPLNGMQTFAFNNTFTNLTSVSFSGIGGNPEFSIDNIVYNSSQVPEPASFALLGIGLAGIGFSRIRKRD